MVQQNIGKVGEVVMGQMSWEVDTSTPESHCVLANKSSDKHFYFSNNTSSSKSNITTRHGSNIRLGFRSYQLLNLVGIKRNLCILCQTSTTMFQLETLNIVIVFFFFLYKNNKYGDVHADSQERKNRREKIFPVTCWWHENTFALLSHKWNSCPTSKARKSNGTQKKMLAV